MESYVPESKLYQEMQEFERRLDATITRKTLDIQDALAKPCKVFLVDVEGTSNITNFHV
jgi:SWI/SNF-related matrix-associated actin-dependent regulator of chromatin subfamily D